MFHNGHFGTRVHYLSRTGCAKGLGLERPFDNAGASLIEIGLGYIQ